MSKLVCTLSAFALASFGAFGQSTIPPVVVHTTGMIGLTEGQTARFNVLNPGVLPPALGVVCNATLTFYGAGGNVLKSASVTANPGQSQFLDLFGDADLGLMINGHKEVRATFMLPAIVPPPTPMPGPSPSASTASPSASTASPSASTAPQSACTLIGTLEIIDSTGHAQVVLGGTHEVPAGPVTASSAN